MKKIIIALLISLTSIFLSTGCTNEIDKLITVESDIKIEDSNVTLKVKEDTLTKTGATFILENNKNNAINYTIAYEIEAKRDNKYIDKLYQRFKFNDAETMKRFNEIYRLSKEYIEQ